MANDKDKIYEKIFFLTERLSFFSEGLRAKVNWSHTESTENTEKEPAGPTLELD